MYDGILSATEIAAGFKTPPCKDYKSRRLCLVYIAFAPNHNYVVYGMVQLSCILYSASYIRYLASPFMWPGLFQEGKVLLLAVWTRASTPRTFNGVYFNQNLWCQSFRQSRKVFSASFL